MRYKLPDSLPNDYDKKNWDMGTTKYLESEIKIEKEEEV